MRPAAGPTTWRCGDLDVDCGTHPLLMGILNVTPDSFSDGGQHTEHGAAVDRALAMLEEGADIIDIGGESTRPGSDGVDAETELARVIPVVRDVRRQCAAPISIDTSKAVVARAAADVGACIINDVSACTSDTNMAKVVRETKAGLVLMHMQGSPRSMQAEPRYDDVVADVRAFLGQRVAAMADEGVERSRIVVDPGIGFGKTADHNVALLRQIGEFAELGMPVLVGLSRKRFLGALTGAPVDERLPGGLAALVWCILNGVSIMRVHDVKASRDARRVAMALSANAKEDT